jgi:hypothetical protein
MRLQVGVPIVVATVVLQQVCCLTSLASYSCLSARDMCMQVASSWTMTCYVML